MSSSNVLESVLSLQKQRAEAAEQSFRDLVRQLASGPKKPPSAESIDAVLIASRHSVDDLASAVRLVQRREQLRAEIREIDQRQDDRAGLVAEIEMAKAELEVAQAKFKERTFPAQRAIDEIDQMHHRRQAAERELRDLIDDDQHDRLAELESSIRQASAAKDQQARVLRDIRARQQSPDQDVRELAIEQAARAEAALAELSDQCDRLVQRQTELLHEAKFG